MTTDLWQYPFVHQALMAGVITAIMTGVVGPFVVMRNMGFAVHGLAEVGFTGAAGAVLFDASPEVGVLVAALVTALAIGVLGVRLRERDIAIGAVLAFGLGLGVLFLTLYTRYATEAFSILFGTILAVSLDDVVRSAVVAVVALSALAVIYRPLRFASVDPEVAAARGVPIGLLSAVFLVILALAVTEAVEVVGVLLIVTLLITPAGAAQRLTANPARGDAAERRDLPGGHARRHHGGDLHVMAGQLFRRHLQLCDLPGRAPRRASASSAQGPPPRPPATLSAPGQTTTTPSPIDTDEAGMPTRSRPRGPTGRRSSGRAAPEYGLRVTPQRVAILRALAAGPHVATCHEIWERARAGTAGLGQVTVYRILDRFEAAGIVERLDVNGTSHLALPRPATTTIRSASGAAR